MSFTTGDDWILWALEPVYVDITDVPLKDFVECDCEFIERDNESIKACIGYTNEVTRP